MLTAVKNQFRITTLSIKYATMREMINKWTFFSNIIFMVLNNSFMIVQWIVLFSIRDEMGGYRFKEILLIWAMAASVYGFSRFLFKNSFTLSETINSGKLDAFLVQPKNVLLSCITSDVQVSALGDMLFGLLAYCVYGFKIETFLLFILFTISGGLMLTSISVILNSISFWINNADLIADVGNKLMVDFAIYPDGIFKGLTKWMLFTIVPVGIANYIPVKTIINFNPQFILINITICVLLVGLSFIIFYQGLKRYSSSNLMSARV